MPGIAAPVHSNAGFRFPQMGYSLAWKSPEAANQWRLSGFAAPLPCDFSALILGTVPDMQNVDSLLSDSVDRNIRQRREH